MKPQNNEEFYGRLSLLCSERGIKPNTLCNKIKIASGTITNWNGSFPKSTEHLLKLSEFFNCSIDYLLGLTNIRDICDSSNIINIPIVEQRASAGLGSNTTDISDISHINTYFDINNIPVGSVYGIIIEGDSMSPKFVNGQIVFINPEIKCNINEYGIFKVITQSEVKIYCKQFREDENGNQFLHSKNTDYKDIFIDDKTSQCICVGKIL